MGCNEYSLQKYGLHASLNNIYRQNRADAIGVTVPAPGPDGCTGSLRWFPPTNFGMPDTIAPQGSSRRLYTESVLNKSKKGISLMPFQVMVQQPGLD